MMKLNPNFQKTLLILMYSLLPIFLQTGSLASTEYDYQNWSSLDKNHLGLFLQLNFGDPINYPSNFSSLIIPVNDLKLEGTAGCLGLSYLQKLPVNSTFEQLGFHHNLMINLSYNFRRMVGSRDDLDSNYKSLYINDSNLNDRLNYHSEISASGLELDAIYLFFPFKGFSIGAGFSVYYYLNGKINEYFEYVDYQYNKYSFDSSVVIKQGELTANLTDGDLPDLNSFQSSLKTQIGYYFELENQYDVYFSAGYEHYLMNMSGYYKIKSTYFYFQMIMYM